jgi:Protein of unknown function (DUF3567)
MNMLYNSDQYVVVRFDFHAAAAGDAGEAAQGGFEIVDKLARKEIFIVGALAEKFQRGVQALAEHEHTAEELDEYIAGFTGHAQHALTLH